MADVRVSVRLVELGTGRRFSVGGSGPDEATAIAEAKNKLKLTCGSVSSVSESKSLDKAGYTANADTQYSDAVLVLSRGEDYPNKTVRLENISTAYRLANSVGLLDLSNADLQAFATAYRDAEGNSGYSLVAGEFTD